MLVMVTASEIKTTSLADSRHN